MLWAAALLLMGILPNAAEPVSQHFDSVELNYYYDGTGKLVFRQVIFWDCDIYDEYHVAGWMIPEMLVSYQRGRQWRFLVLDKNKLYRFTSSAFSTTRTIHDPERADLEEFPESKRIGIWKRRH